MTDEKFEEAQICRELIEESQTLLQSMKLIRTALELPDGPMPSLRVPFTFINNCRFGFALLTWLETATAEELRYQQEQFKNL